MLVSEKPLTASFPKMKRQNVFSPAQIRKMGGVDAILEKFKEKRNEPLPDLGFTEAEWEEMLKKETYPKDLFLLVYQPEIWAKMTFGLQQLPCISI